MSKGEKYQRRVQAIEKGPRVEPGLRTTRGSHRQPRDSQHENVRPGRKDQKGRETYKVRLIPKEEQTRAAEIKGEKI